MNYLRVRWPHQFPDEPVWLCSELDEGRWETRKVYVFPDGSKTFASRVAHNDRTFLSELPLPALESIGADPQFIAEEIASEEFEAVWADRGSPAVL
jgi:hypothetical protein